MEVVLEVVADGGFRVELLLEFADLALAVLDFLLAATDVLVEFLEETVFGEVALDLFDEHFVGFMLELDLTDFILLPQVILVLLVG